jgi:hypothetical protein
MAIAPADDDRTTLRRLTVLKEVGVALLVGFIAGAVFLLGQLMYAQLVLMPRLVASGKDVLAVTVEARWSLAAAAVAFLAYLTFSATSGSRREN